MIDGRQATRILFCADPLDKRHVDSVYEPEAAAAEGLGVAYDLLDFEALINDGNASTAVRGVRQSMERKCPPGRTIEVRVSSRQTAHAKKAGSYRRSDPPTSAV